MNTDLLNAASCGDIETLRTLLDRGVTEMVDACHVDMVPLLLCGASIDTRDIHAQTALMRAARHGHTEIVRLLLDRGALVDARDKKGQSALMIAARYGHTEVICLLLERGAMLDAIDKNGNTALIISASEGQLEALLLLHARGASVQSANSYGSTALMKASKNRHEQVVRSLLDLGPSIEAADNYGNTALTQAILADSDTVIVELLKNQTSLQKQKLFNQVSNTGEDALTLALKYHHYSAVLELEKQGAKRGGQTFHPGLNHAIKSAPSTKKPRRIGLREVEKLCKEAQEYIRYKKRKSH